jgi:2-C-methyl-D-erythritol 4-phosphate cytidylyltransferase/2-C-methyl-D-erythritol 2,4-cyclodiphosphate synthase
MHFAALIVAAGTGSRMGGPPKQWRSLLGRSVAAWSVEVFAAKAAQTVLIVGATDVERARAEFAGLRGLSVVVGGDTRTQSVRAGLAALQASDVDAVLIHDAARPLVAARHIDAVLGGLEAADGAILAEPVTDTLKRADANGAVIGTADRTGLWRAQTPQAFRLAALVAAYANAQDDATDDAALIERAGGRVRLVPGDPLLMKITHAEDFAMIERLAGAARIVRVGQGFDAHRFGPGDNVWLCGVEIAHSQTLIGHSDADAGLHALTDAILGAIGEGDIGDHFPPSDPKWKGAASDRFLLHALELTRAKGGRVINVDVTLICEQPKIKPHRQAMRERLAALLDLPLDRISVKATTTEGMGFTGRGEGLAAQALASVETPV